MQKPLPDQTFLQEALRYEPSSGELFWLERPRQHFFSDTQYKRVNTRYTDQPALSSKSNEGYLVGGINGVVYQAHRIIWKMMTGQDPQYIDHINGDRTDNSWNNLRNVPWQTNYQNQRKPRNNSSGVIGVYQFKGSNSWIARICVNHRHINLGTFAEFHDAVKARKQAELDYGFHPNHGN